jgi:type I restriction enzyme S subunit
MIENIPAGWRVENFLNIIKDDTAKKEKIPANNYKSVGNIPIIDQGKKLISGYTNDKKHLNTNQPVIIFGDHTRSLKYIDFNFAIGADGVKVLKKTERSSNTKYLYYYLLSKPVPNTGYNRHFKYLKRTHIPIPPIKQQQKIVKVLDITTNLINQQQELLKQYDLFLKSKFIEMFGDPVKNPMGWEISKIGKITEVKTGKTPSRKNNNYWNNGTINWAKTTEVNKSIIKNTEEKITNSAVKECNMILFDKNTILIAMYGQGKTRGKVALLDTQTTINQAFGAIIESKLFNTLYLLKLLDFMYKNIRDLGRGGNQENLNLDIVKNINIILPPINLQNKFADIVEKTENIKTRQNKKLLQLQNLHNSLMQKAFKGEIK